MQPTSNYKSKPVHNKSVLVHKCKEATCTIHRFYIQLVFEVCSAPETAPLSGRSEWSDGGRNSSAEVVHRSTVAAGYKITFDIYS